MSFEWVDETLYNPTQVSGGVEGSSSGGGSVSSSSVSGSTSSGNIGGGNIGSGAEELLPCESYEKDGFCARGPNCTFKHESAIENINLIEFLFEYETIIPKATSKKVRKINEITNDQQETISIEKTNGKPIIRKSKKTKIEKRIPQSLDSISTIERPIETIQEEPYDIPLEYSDINFEKPIIPFNFSFHTPTFHRQSTLQELIDLNMKNTTNRKKAIVLAFMKGKRI